MDGILTSSGPSASSHINYDSPSLLTTSGSTCLFTETLSFVGFHSFSEFGFILIRELLSTANPPMPSHLPSVLSSPYTASSASPIQTYSFNLQRYISGNVHVPSLKDLQYNMPNTKFTLSFQTSFSCVPFYNTIHQAPIQNCHLFLVHPYSDISFSNLFLKFLDYCYQLHS